MTGSPPLRFLIVLLAGWAALRTAFLAPAWWTAPAGAGPPRPHPEAGPGVRRREQAAVPSVRARTAPVRVAAVASTPAPPRRSAAAAAATVALPLAPPPGRRAGAAEADTPLPGGIPVAAAAAALISGSRWSGTMWLFLREGGAPALAAGGMLGGGQAGARLALRLNRDPRRPLALVARVTAPVGRAAGAEAALALDWRPSRRFPLHLVGERRQAAGRDGRSAFAVAAYGGFDDLPLGRLRVDGYAQAGIVGARSRDPFADGGLRASLAVGGGLRLGAGAWAAAQPGAARLDAGPHASLRLPLAGRDLIVAADWRLRLAGDARPGSGPALTLATDF